MGVRGYTRPTQLGPNMTLEGFACGLAFVDGWVAERAADAKRRGTAVVYVSHRAGADPAAEPPAGIYALSSVSIARAEVAGGWLRRNAPEQIPAILLGVLGVDSRHQGRGLGAMLLHDAAVRALSVADAIGVKALVVDPANAEAARFYERHGLRAIPGDKRMFAPLDQRMLARGGLPA